MNYSKLLASFVLCFSIAALGSLMTTPAIPTWYADLVKPSFNPPNWVFGPVWTVLYFLMSISLYLTWVKRESKKRKHALAVFCLQLTLNLLWSAVFFGLQNPLFGFIVITLLWIAIAITIMFTKQVSKTASWLLIPYIVWVSYAGILNAVIVGLN